MERNIKELKRKRDLLRDVYMTTYLTDGMGCELDSTATFEDLYQALLEHKDVYIVMGCADSIIRERLLNILADKYTDESVEEIFHLWFEY